MSERIALSDTLADAASGGQPERLSQAWFDRIAVEKGGVVARLWSFAAAYEWPRGDWPEVEAAAARAGYGLHKIAGRGTGYGIVILTARNKRASALLRQGRRLALQRELGCSASEAAALEPVCRAGWVRECAEQVLEHLRWLRTADRQTVAATLNQAWREWRREGRGWGRCCAAAASLLGLDAPSTPRLDALLKAAFKLATRELDWQPPR